MLKPEDIKKERDRFTQDNLSSDNKSGMIIYDNKFSDVKSVESKPYTPNALQMQQIQENVCTHFGTNMDILQNKFNEDTWNAYYEGKIEPFAIQLSLVMSNMTFTPRELARGNAITFSANRLQYASNNTKLQVSTQLFDRETRYVLVIPVAHIGDTIKLSESQYSAAQRIGESYELFVIATEASEAEYIYIKNPYEKVELNRVVKEWEWVCDKYDKEKQIQPVTEAEVVDDYILKNILPDYFNRQQRNFLQDIIMSEDDINYDDKYKISIEQINSIADFYTSRKMIDVMNGKIMISMDKKAALKKILGI